MSQDVDSQLIQQIKAGDSHAFQTLVLKYQSRVIRLLSRFVRNKEDVHDLVQDIFLKAYRSIHNFRAESLFYTWLYRIAINTAKNHINTSNRYKHFFLPQEADENALLENTPDFDTPERVMIAKQIARTIVRTVHALPDELRSAFLLRELDCVSYENIAKMMNCPVGTIRSRIFRARESALKKIKIVFDG